VRRTCCVWLWVMVLSALCSAAQRGDGPPPGEQFLGTWSGTWDGAGTGGFELTLEKDKSSVIGGRVSVTGEPAYKATLKEVSFDGKKMAAKYDFPPDPGGEIRLATTFDGETATGTWALHEKATGNQVATGTWTVKRK
jgi:hypothetical protein